MIRFYSAKTPGERCPEPYSPSLPCHKPAAERHDCRCGQSNKLQCSYV